MENNPNQPKKRAYNRKKNIVESTENSSSEISSTEKSLQEKSLQENSSHEIAPTEIPTTKKRTYNRKNSPLTPKGGTEKAIEIPKNEILATEIPVIDISTQKKRTYNRKKTEVETPKNETPTIEIPIIEPVKLEIFTNPKSTKQKNTRFDKNKNQNKTKNQNLDFVNFEENTNSEMPEKKDIPENKNPRNQQPRNQPQNKQQNPHENKANTENTQPNTQQNTPTRDWEKELTKFFERNPQKSIHINRIFKELRVNTNQKGFLVDALEQVLMAGKAIITEKGDFQSTTQNPEKEIVEGKVDFVNVAYAFVICEGKNDIWVNAIDMKDALDGDIVRVALVPNKKDTKPEGKIIDVLVRKRDEFVGKLEFYHRNAFVAPEMRRMYRDIQINNTKGAKRGDKVVVKITDWGNKFTPLTGDVIEVLGKAGTNNAEMPAILAEFNLPRQFPQEVLDETAKIHSQVTPAEIKKRRDFRHITTFTIDPVDAKDFDDALSLLPLDNGNWQIGVHIADASHYIRPNTELDKEAIYRATSVYLVDRVVPMLPEKLSNELCSLKPNEDRLTFSAVFELDEEGNVHGEWFGKTVIHSNRRFSYEEAQERLDTKKGDYAQEIKVLNYIAKQLTKKRFAKGAINFETTEVKFKLNEQGVPIGIYFKERKEAHRLIEEYMLLANQRVAEFVVSQTENDRPKAMVYRIHESPNAEKLENFSKFAKTFGYEISLFGKQMARSINKLIDDTNNTPQQNILQSLAVRTMAKAKYSTETIGHFGLAMPHYTHFTSPIRRYPDILAHRLLEKYLTGGASESQKTLDKICQHATDMEKRASEAERASTKYKQVEYMQLQDQNKIYDGVVTGVTEWGVYVEITETKCEGMVRLSEIWDDQYVLDAPNYCVIGTHTGKKIMFGDLVKVKLKNTNIEKRTIDLSIVLESLPNQTTKRQRQRQKEKQRKQDKRKL